MNDLEERSFSQSFSEARDKFLAAAEAAGASMSRYVHGLPALDGGPLSCDAAWVGDPDAENVLVTVSGTHGVEGFAGSAVQVADLRHLSQNPLEKVAVLHIHAINPWGMDRLHRTTENNVDLNRNFVDHAAGPPENQAYGEIHEIVCPTDWDSHTEEKIKEALEAFSNQRGANILANALMSGQYSHTDGLGFGGHGPEWSNQVLSKICKERLSDAERVVFVDWHTGMGGYGEGVFLCFHDRDREEFKLACDWFGRSRIDAEHFPESGTPKYKGLLCVGARQSVPDSNAMSLVVEFGTHGRSRVRPALMLDRWLRGVDAVASDPVPALRAQVREVFDPQQSAWREAVVSTGGAILADAMTGLSKWR